MRKILSSPIFRAFLCAVLICALLINVSPIKARADVVSGGLVAAGATGAVVSVPVAIAIGATLIALGIIADAASQNPYALQKLASDVGDALAAGTYVQDGMVEMYRFVTDTGEAMYYVGADFLETVRGWLFDSNSICKTVSYNFPASLGSEFPLRYSECLKHKVSLCFRGLNDTWYCCYSDSSFFIQDGDFIRLASGQPFYFASTSKNYFTTTTGIGSLAEIYNPIVEVLTSDLDVSLGVISTVPIDGTSARTWSEAYANRGLYIASGGSQNPDDGGEGNDGWKFLLPLAFLAGADLWAMSQADQWTGSTPPEFGDYTTEEELTVTPAPEFDGYQAIEIAPAPNTNPDPGTGINPDPGTGTNPDPGTGTNPDPGTNSGTGSWTPPSDMGKFTLDLKQYFPFCIPFDLYAFFTCLNAEPVAPVIEWIIPLPGGKTYPFEIDLSAFDSVAQILRRMQLLLFCVGLAFKTRDLIKG